MATSSLNLNKFEVAERQLNQAIQLFFDEGDPVSIHTLAEAAAQLLYDIRDEFGAKSLTRDSDLIRPEFKKEWLASLFSSRNFFKHADRDPKAVHEFKEEFNHFSIMDAVNMYLTAKRSWTPESIVFLQWFCTKYPKAIREGTEVADFFNRYRATAPSDEQLQRQIASRVIREMRQQSRSIAGVTLDNGLKR